METETTFDPYQLLYRFMLAELGADKFPDDLYVPVRLECERCGGVPMEIRLVHQTGSTPNRFGGQVIGLCTGCGRRTTLWGSSGSILQGERMVEKIPEAVERIACDCGGTKFHLSLMNHFEDTGYYDDGVLAGCCAGCRGCRVLTRFD